MASNEDPFPLLHIIDSRFELSNLAALTSAQLAAAWIIPHPDYDEAVHKRKIAKLWRSRREKGRQLLGVKPIGRHATAEEQRQDPFTGFELLDLDFAVPDDLNQLTSAQLAALPFHPTFTFDAGSDVAETAEELFYARREQTFKDKTVTPLAPAAGAASVLVAAQPTPPAPTPAPPIQPLAPAPPLASAIAAAAPAAPPTPAITGAAAWLDAEDMDVDKPVAEPRPVVRIPLNEWRAGQKKKVEQQGPLGSASSNADEAELGDKRERPWELSPRSATARRRRTDEPPARPVDNRPPRGSYGRQDDRNSSGPAARPPADAGWGRRDPGPGARDSAPPPQRRQEWGQGSQNGGRDDRHSRRPSSPPPPYVTGFERFNDHRIGHNDPPRRRTSPSPPRDRSLPPHANNSRPASSSNPPPPPPEYPRESDEVPLSLINQLAILFMRQVPESIVDPREFVDFLVSKHPVPPIGVKLVRSKKGPHSARTGRPVQLAYVAYERGEDSDQARRRVHGQHLHGEIVTAVDAATPRHPDGTPKSTSEWRWFSFSRDFMDKWHRDSWRSIVVASTAHHHLPLSTDSATTVLLLRPRDSLRRRRNGQSQLPTEFPTRAISDGHLGALRDFVDELDGIVGMYLGDVEHSTQTRAAWLAFTRKDNAEAALRALRGKSFGGVSRGPLAVEIAFGCNRRVHWLWPEMTKTFRKEHQQASNDSSPSQPSGPRSEPPLIISSPPTGSSSQPPTSTNGPAPQPSLNHHPSAPAETEALSVSSAFVHPSRLGMVNTAAPVTSSPPVKDDEQDLIVVEGSFKRQAPTQRAPLLTGSDAQSKATNAAVKTVEDAWASKRSSALSQRAESESSTSTPRRDSVVSRGSESPTKPSSSSTSTTMSSWDVSNFINQAVAGPFAPSYPSIAPASAPAEVRPPSTPSSEGLTRARSIHSSLPQKPYDIAVPYPTPNARSVPPPSPTRPRALLSIKGAGRSPTSPPTALNGSASTSAAPRGPRADQPKTNVLSVAGGAARQRATSWATSPPQPPTQPPQDQAEITSEPVKTAVNGAATVSDRPTSAPSAVAEQVVSSGDGPSSSSVDGMQAGKELSADVGDEGSGEGTGEKQAPVAEGDGQKAEKEVTMDVEEDK